MCLVHFYPKHFLLRTVFATKAQVIFCRNVEAACDVLKAF